MKAAPEAFEKAYQSLNSAQKQAVDAIEGPVMVVAGPGTGKTQILTLRIANILAKTDVRPEQILALTFTEAAALNMRRRLAELIGSSAYRVVIDTFHGFCNDIIKRYPEDFPKIIGSKSITEIEQVSIIESIIEESDLVLLKPFGDRLLYVRDIVSAIGELKREGLTPERFSDLVDEEYKKFEQIDTLYHEKGPHKGKMKGEYQKLERKILKNKELSLVYASYQQKLFEQKQYDFNDMILEVLAVLEGDAALLQLLQEEHQYILVDEHQDTNNAQNKLVERIMNYHDHPNLFVVGDEKQAVYRFQGASLENFHFFKRLYPSAVLIALTDNYRSTQTILDTAQRLLAGERLIKKTNHVEHPIHVAAFSTNRGERYYLAHAINELIITGTRAEDIAVLYRNNKDAFAVAEALAAISVPYSIESDQDLFSQSDVKKFLVLLRAIAEYGNDVILAPVLHLSLFGIDPLDAYKVLRYANDTKSRSLFELLTDKEALITAGLGEYASTIALGENLKRWVQESREQNLIAFFEHVFKDSGLMQRMLGLADVDERMDAMRTLFDIARGLVQVNSSASLTDFFIYLDTVKKHNLFLKRKNQESRAGTVRLMTVHRSKGLEFDHVYIYNAIDGVFGGKTNRERLPLIDAAYGVTTETLDDDDERRLFYVALTRAKHSITITYAHEDAEKRMTLPSVFISDLRSELVVDVATAEWEDRANVDKEFHFSGNTPVSAPLIKDQEFVTQLFKKQGLSPTALNNYLECPWKYFYQNLIRIPAAQSIHQCYGIAVHAALQDLFKRLVSEGADKSFLLESFKGHLYRQPLPNRDLDVLLEKGAGALSGWFDAYNNSWNLRVKTEFRINGIELSENVHITGVLDKAEFVDDEVVEVVDYKTAKPKTRNELMGKTKGADGNYYRQLVFYKLLLNHFDDGKFSMQSGTIDFIEPDEKGKYHKETFEIGSDEVKELTKTILRVSDEILTLSFWDKTCSKKDCEFCRLRGLISQ